MQKVSNIVDMLFASVTGIQTFQPIPAVQDPNQSGIDFLQILGGLISPGNETEQNLLTSFNESELNQVKSLFAQSDSPNGSLIPFNIPLSNSDQNGIANSVKEPEILSLLTGQSKHPVTFSPFINMENYSDTVPLESAENLVLEPGENDELNIGRLIDSPFVYDRGSNLSDQGGRSVFSNMLNVVDLEKLNIGESLTIKMPDNGIPEIKQNPTEQLLDNTIPKINQNPIEQQSDNKIPEINQNLINGQLKNAVLNIENYLPTTQMKYDLQNIAEITFTKKTDLEPETGLNGSRFEVTFKSGNDAAQLQAVLVNSKSNPQVKDLEELIVEHQAKDAKLVLFVPAEKASVEQIQMSGIKTEQVANHTNFNPLMADNSNAKLRQFNLQRNPGQQTEISNVIQNSEQTETKTAVIPKQESDFGHTLGESKQDLGAALLQKAGMPQYNSQNFEGFADKLSSSLSMDIQNPGNKVEESVIDDKARLQMLTRDVQFKIDQPLNKAELPDGGSFRIRLTPESLGKIDVQLDVIQDRMMARMVVDSPLAKQVVESNLESLKETLHQSGIKVENITVNISGQNDNSDLSNHQTRQFAGDKFRNSNYDLEMEDSEVMPEMSDSQNNINLQGSMSIFA